MAEQRTYPSGVTSWIDVEQPDPEAAENFYGAVFGWTFTTVTPPQAPFRYAIAQLDGQDVAGIGSVGHGGPQWNTYVAVDDADAVVSAVEAGGGRVISAPVAAGEAGRPATFVDPAGVEFRIWEASRRLGAQVTNAPGSWNFSDLHSDDPARDFYAAIFGWVYDEGESPFIKVPGYGQHLASTVDPHIYERQAQLPEGFADVIGALAPLRPDEVPHWHVTFAVADRDTSADHIAASGGEVLSTGDDEWSRHAVGRDPQGAVFTVSQFVEPDSWA